MNHSGSDLPRDRPRDRWPWSRLRLPRSSRSIASLLRKLASLRFATFPLIVLVFPAKLSPREWFYGKIKAAARFLFGVYSPNGRCPARCVSGFVEARFLLLDACGCSGKRFSALCLAFQTQLFSFIFAFLVILWILLHCVAFLRFLLEFLAMRIEDVAKFI